MHYTEYDTRLSAYAVVTDGSGDGQRVLLALWNERTRPRWTLPGGGVELHETVEEAVVREVREESGYDVRLGRLLGVQTWVVGAEERWANDRPMRGAGVLFEAEVVGGELTHEVDGTTEEARWVRLDEVSSMPRVPLVDQALRLAGLA